MQGPRASVLVAESPRPVRRPPEHRRTCRTPPCPRSRRRRRRPQRGSASVACGAAAWPQGAVAFSALYRFRSKYPHHGGAPASGVSRRRDEGGAGAADLPDEKGGGGDSAAVPRSR